MAAITKSPAGEATSPRKVSLREAFGFWLKLGFISFGGPAGQIAIMHQELVEQRRWISERRFLHALNYCMVLPGPEAQQLATYIGWLMHRTWGGLIAGGLFVLPSLSFLILLSWVYLTFGHLPAVEGVFYGIKPAVTAIVLCAGHRISSRTLNNGPLLAIAALSFVAIFVFKVPFPLIVILAACIGWVGGRTMPHKFQVAGQHQTAEKANGTSLIDDDGPTLEHTRFSVKRLIKIASIGAALWILPMVALYRFLGWDHTYTQMGWFFTKAALVTFGGAYAVLPYVYQGAVSTYGWVTPTQMIDGLALGETTPGPLVMVVAFVAFVGGYGQADLGPNALFAAGTVAALVVTWFTFLPSFLFILIGGPLVESTRGDLKFTAPLTAITAAVVGVIVNLALFFGYHVVWPDGFSGRFDPFAAIMILIATAVLMRYKGKIVSVIGLAALLGLANQFLFRL